MGCILWVPYLIQRQVGGDDQRLTAAVSAVHDPPSCSFEKALPGPAAGYRAALLCGSGLYPEESEHRADIAAVEYQQSNNLK